MTQYSILKVKLPNSQINKLNSEIKNNTEVTLKSSWNVVGDSNMENNFPHELLLTNTQVSNLRKAFTDNSSANIKLSRAQLHKLGQWRGSLGRFLGPLLKTGLPLIINVLKQLAKNVLLWLGLTEAALATDAAIPKKMFGSGFAILIISNEEMNDIMKIVKFPEESGLLIKDFNETIKNEAKEQKGRYIGMLLGTLGASLLGNLLTEKGAIATSWCRNN